MDLGIVLAMGVVTELAMDLGMEATDLAMGVAMDLHMVAVMEPDMVGPWEDLLALLAWNQLIRPPFKCWNRL